AILGASERVDLKTDTGDPERCEETPGHLDDFRIERRRTLSDALDTHLRELVLPPCLGPLGSEERTRVVHPNPLDLLVEVGAERGAQCAGGALRPQGQGASATILEGEHLLLDDVRVRSHAADEQIGRLDDRRLDCPVAEGLRDRAMGIEPPSTGTEFVGQNVARSFWGCDLRHWRPSVRACGCGALSGPGVSGTIRETAWHSRGLQRRVSV